MTAVRKALLLGMLSLMLGGAAAADISARESALAAKIAPLVPIVVTAISVKAGRYLDARQLALRMIPQRWMPAGSLTRITAGRRLVAAVDLPRGAVLGPGAFRDAGSVAEQLASGERATTVSALAPLDALQVGIGVDVLAAAEGARPRLVVKDAGVIAWRRIAESDAGSASRVEVDLQTDLHGALDLAAAAAEGAELRLLPIGEN
ncbi:MAG: hypothetical protein NT122_00065 [Solirubrobacterales bacterium]|nr:hypothetical protein [Solirubrobacterales bacterium]